MTDHRLYVIELKVERLWLTEKVREWREQAIPSFDQVEEMAAHHARIEELDALIARAEEANGE